MFVACASTDSKSVVQVVCPCSGNMLLFVNHHAREISMPTLLRTVGEFLFWDSVQVLRHLAFNVGKRLPFESERKASESHNSLCGQYLLLCNGGHAWEPRRHSRISGSPNGISCCFWFISLSPEHHFSHVGTHFICDSSTVVSLMCNVAIDISVARAGAATSFTGLYCQSLYIAHPLKGC